MDESTNFEQVVDSSQLSLMPLGSVSYNLSGNDADEEFLATSFSLQEEHTFGTFDMFQNTLYPDELSYLLNIDPIENDDLFLTVHELGIPDENGPSQSPSERQQLQHEPLIDPQMSTSTIL
ncbi:hypothetical protein FVEN_g9468 [Fusarium venenatum]|nr:hypothetical protein FVEN_g9468 [Fusarium venenatum]